MIGTIIGGLAGVVLGIGLMLRGIARFDFNDWIGGALVLVLTAGFVMGRLLN